ncbi:NAD(P)H-dependent oxidoreductase [Aurantimonas endophytica]|uniref:Putative homoserine dehydrogenase-like protein n=1 Tax=Aurantimonas endophytica TaxID=1522175 RepID=A0A7W6HE63_9HYPH|nr:flagellar biosynthesis protein FlgA [Aurantimonas endophytica]MBB4003391.1 putative homoserine dehydrogenase-like protein [Aurantimonas endophytica]MCO6404252.1 flagellar biosynthesis protein FlgA [Aurantimonas endophytica]
MNFHTYFAGAAVVETCIVGTGGFGRSFLVQGLRVPLMNARIAVDVDAESAAQAIQSAGVARDAIAICRTPDEAEAAWSAGKHVAAGDIAVVIGLPFAVLLEATGHPEAGARHARLAIEAGKHVVMVTKEADSVVGPGLALLARQKGVVVTPVDGDQPSLLISLVTWAELLGFEIIAAGKSSEYDFVYDAAAGTLTSNGVTIDADAFAGLDRLGDADAAERARARSQAAAAFDQHLVPDLCEMSLVANATGLNFDREDFHAPIARIDEVPTFLSMKADGGLLDTSGSLDVFHCLRSPDEISFAGGVFVVVRCEDEATWDMLAEKGHVVSRNGATAMIYNPRHLLGLEAATSVLAAAVHGVSQGMVEPRHRVDLVARAEIDLPAGTLLTASGHHHRIEGVSGRVVPAQRLAPDAPVPFYLAANRVLVRPVARGQNILLADIAVDARSDMFALRQMQDAHFFG